MSRPIDLMIAGAEKSGTSSLLRYLGAHPEICIHAQREMNYFVRDEEYIQGYESAFERYFAQGPMGESRIVAKSVDVMYLPEGARRLWEHNPEIQVVAVLRNPVDRAYSAYWHARRRGWESLKSFEEAIEAEPVRLSGRVNGWRHLAYLDRGIYMRQLERLNLYFPKEQIHLFLFDDFKQDPNGICGTLFQVLGLPTSSLPESTVRHNVSAEARSELLAGMLVSRHPLKRLAKRFLPDGAAYAVKNRIQKLNEREFTPPPMNPATRQRLVEYFKPYNDSLSGFLGRDLSRWNAY